jgi:alkylated DNA repair dioxygenase AlkB
MMKEEEVVVFSLDGKAVLGIEHVVSDSFVVRSFLQTVMHCDVNKLFDTLNKNAFWTDPSNPDLMYRGRELARKKAFLVKEMGDDDNDDGVVLMDVEPSVMPIYRYPGFQYGSMQHYRDMRSLPEVNNLVEELCKRSLFAGKAINVNHVILTNYRGADDNIGFHSDKTRDMTPGSLILSLSLGETREFHLGTPDASDPKMSTVTTHRIVLNPGDLFILGPKTNVSHRHSIVPVSEEKLSTRKNDDIVVGPRISMVLRDIQSVMSRDEARKRALKTQGLRVLRASEKKTAGKKKQSVKRKTSK